MTTAKKFLESLPITLQEKIQKAQKKTWRIASHKPVRPPQQLLTEYAEITPMLTVKAETYRTVMTSHMSALK